jgi:hypothetical protein
LRILGGSFGFGLVWRENDRRVVAKINGERVENGER